MDLGECRRAGHEDDAVTPTRATTCHTKTCAPLLGKDTKLARKQARRDRMDREHGIVGKELKNGRVAEEMTKERKEARRAPRAANPIGTATKDKGSKGKGKGKRETRYCYGCGEQGHIGVNCPHKRANSIDEEDDQTSSWESEPEGENAEELASLDTPDEEGEWCWPKKSRVLVEKEN